MNLTCPNGSELKTLLDANRWPMNASPDLQAHVPCCASCRSLLVLSQTFRADRTAIAASAHLEAPGVLWWRAQLRRRNNALHQIGRPLLGAQIFAAGSGFLAALLYLLTQLRHKEFSGASPLTQWLAWFTSVPRALRFDTLLPADLQNPSAFAGLVIGGIAAMVLLGSALAYATSEKR